jgi:hypothetical protein
LVALKFLAVAPVPRPAGPAGQRAALKGSATCDPAALERFKREARAASALNHPSEESRRRGTTKNLRVSDSQNAEILLPLLRHQKDSSPGFFISLIVLQSGSGRLRLLLKTYGWFPLDEQSLTTCACTRADSAWTRSKLDASSSNSLVSASRSMAANNS